MKVIGVEHIGIAIKDLEKDAPFWSKVLGIEQTKTEDVDDQGVITDIYDTGRGKIELLLSKYPDSPIGKFLKKRGPGIHHICLQVEDIEESIKVLKKHGIETIGDKSSIGAEGFKVIFIHPRSTGGVLVELAEKT
ncbi:methylmalonyl-CoA epimerase [bacterium]|jgi:methylmalonyl-CoA/ethylmalonyl-CoA epimerase|nr:MAG: methylmalonyl-CoA epimerase [bacterium]|tara:strand:+ start:164 stop:568 length:405 start_codon:yes stop_codon:yes gene_type:complete